MQSSRFTVRVPLPDSDRVFLLNTLTDAQALVSRDVVSLLDRLDGAAATGQAPGALDEASREALGALAEQGFVVTNRADDSARLERFFDDFRADTGTLSVTILTTLQCNFACDYCFQGEHDGPSTGERMSSATAARVVRWVDERLETLAPSLLSLVFFGGEPLVNKPVVYELAEELWHAAAARGVEMKISIITNGLLLTPEVVDRLEPFGLAGVKITLDGDRVTHDRMRPLRGGQGSFDRIIENVRRVAHRVRVTIGGNFDPGSAESFPALLDFLKAQEFAPHLGRVSFKPVIRTTAPLSLSKGITLTAVGSGNAAAARGGTCASATGSSGTSSPCDSCGVADDTMSWLREETARRGFEPPDGVHMGPCQLYRDHAYTVGPEGLIYACPGFTSDTRHAVGHVADAPASSRPAGTPFDRLAPWRACGDCAFIPVCAGGCSVASHTEQGDMHAPTCHKRSLETALVSLAHEVASAA